ncbi:MAG: WG repeat-containing protein [Bacteroidota bacterium]
MKKARFIVFFFLMSALPLQSQDILGMINCTPKADKLFDMDESDAIVAFRSGGKWGLFDKNENKIIRNAEFDFIIHYDGLNGYFAVKNNAVGYYTNEHKESFPSKFKRLGFFHAYEYQVVMNDSVYEMPHPDSSWTSAIARYNYMPLSVNSEWSVTVKGKHLVVIRKYLDREGYNLITVDGGDSVNTDGTVAWSYQEATQKSGVLDMSTGEWLVQPEFFSVKYDEDNLVLSKTKRDPSNTIFSDVYLADKNFKIYDSVTEIEKAEWNENLVKKFLPGNDITELKECGKDFLGMPEFGFYKNNKYGIFSALFCDVTYPPVNDFLYRSLTENYTAYVNKGKLAVEAEIMGIKKTFKNLDSFAVFSQQNMNYEMPAEMYRLNNEYFIPMGETAWMKTDENYLGMGYAISSSVAVYGNLLVVNDYLPASESTDPIKVYDGYGEMMDSISGYDVSGNPIFVYPPPDPGYSKSGVYDISKHTWIIPQKFSFVQKTKTGFSCGYIDYEKRYETFFSCYDLSGKPAFENITATELLNSSARMAAWAGYNSNAGFQPLDIDYTSLYNYHLPVKVRLNGKYGIYELRNLKWAVVPKWDEISLSLYDFYLVVKDKKLGMVNAEGKEFIPAASGLLISASNQNMVADNQWLYSTGDYASGNKKVHINDKNFSLPAEADLRTNCNFFQAQVKNEWVIINEYNNDEYTHPYQLFDEWGNMWDSLDADGNVVMITEGGKRGRTLLYNMNTGKWTEDKTIIRHYAAGNEWMVMDKNFNYHFLDAAFNSITKSEKETNLWKTNLLQGDSLSFEKYIRPLHKDENTDPVQCAYGRYVVKSDDGFSLVDNKGIVLLSGADEISPAIFPYNDLEGGTDNPVLIYAGKKDKTFLYDTDGKMVSEMFGRYEYNTITSLFDEKGNFWFNNGKKSALVNYNGKDFKLSSAFFDTVFIATIIPASNPAGFKNIFAALDGKKSILTDESGNKLYEWINGEKPVHTMLKNIVFVQQGENKCGVFDITAKKMTGMVFESVPASFTSLVSGDTTHTIFLVNTKKGSELWNIFSLKDKIGYKKVTELPFSGIKPIKYSGKYEAKKGKDTYLLEYNGFGFNVLNDQPVKDITCSNSGEHTAFTSENKTYFIHDWQGTLSVIETGGLDSITVMEGGGEYNEFFILHKKNKKGLFNTYTNNFTPVEFNSVAGIKAVSGFFICDEKLFSTNQNRFLSEEKVTECKKLHNSNLVYKTTSGKMYLVETASDKTEKISFWPGYEVHNGRYAFKENGKYGLIDSRDNFSVFLKPEYDSIWPGGYYEDITVKATKQGIIYAYNENYELMVKSRGDNINIMYTDDESRYYRIYSGDKSGVADADGKIIIEPVYYDVYSFYDHFATMTEANGAAGEEPHFYGLINRKGKTILKNEFVRISNPEVDGYYCTVRKTDQSVWLVKHNGKKAKLVPLPKEPVADPVR